MTVPTITTLPTPPERGVDTNATFSTKVDALLTALPDFVTELNAFAPALVSEASVANYKATSSTSNSIGTGAKSFTVETGRMYVAGDYILVADTANPTTNYMYGTVTSYSGTSLVTNITRTGGSGTKTAWTINLSGIQGTGGDVLPSFTGNAGKVLAVNSGETASEWVQDGWESLGSASPSGVNTSTISSIPTTHEDLLVILSLTITGDAISIALSPDGSSFSGASAFTAVTSGSQTLKGGLFIPGYRKDYGSFSGYASVGTSPAISGGVTQNRSWIITGGIQAIRFTATGNFTGTITVLGRR